MSSFQSSRYLIDYLVYTFQNIAVNGELFHGVGAPTRFEPACDLDRDHRTAENSRIVLNDIYSVASDTSDDASPSRQAIIGARLIRKAQQWRSADPQRVAYWALLVKLDGAATTSPLSPVRTVSFPPALSASRVNAFVSLEALPSQRQSARARRPRPAAFRPFYARRRIPDVMRWSKPKFTDCRMRPCADDVCISDSKRWTTADLLQVVAEPRQGDERCRTAVRRDGA